jgi:hypothetical protein
VTEIDGAWVVDIADEVIDGIPHAFVGGFLFGVGD